MGRGAGGALPRRRRHVLRSGRIEVSAGHDPRRRRYAYAAVGRRRRQAAVRLSARRRSLRKRSCAIPAGALMHWAKVSERGGVWGIRFLFAAYRLLGRGVFTVLLYPVVVYFYV